jgi:ATP/maltotriose-dependent transcriptional regulator MalT
MCLIPIRSDGYGMTGNSRVKGLRDSRREASPRRTRLRCSIGPRCRYGVSRGRAGVRRAHRATSGPCGGFADALAAYWNALRYQLEYRFTTETADTLDGLAALAAGLNRLELAAKLHGTAVGWRETYRQEQWFPMPNDFHESAADVRRHLGERAWFDAYEAGRKLNSEQAMGLADVAVSALEEELQRRSSGLTVREIDVLPLVVDGLNNTEIADRLVLSPRTVHAHLRSIFDKLGVNSRTAAAHAAAPLFVS